MKTADISKSKASEILKRNSTKAEHSKNYKMDMWKVEVFEPTVLFSHRPSVSGQTLGLAQS